MSTHVALATLSRVHALCWLGRLGLATTPRPHDSEQH
jgi:hypothetical protein